ncbi:MAG: radical SAM protein [Phycisphaerae bacterium SG8_4]|nr:MAG: radical SAM protein [Phycisphaerae bacterium SG8_4]
MTVQTTDLGNQEYVYGPVPSRRLGRSLGVDIVPFKTCTYDCIYCQLGRTTNKTIERREWVPCDSVIDQVKANLDSKPDYIALSGSGEPTLNSKIGEVISQIKAITDIPVAVLTNGSLLWLPEVRRSLMAADLVLPSLDAGSDRLFRYVNRPHPNIHFGRMLDGLVKFRNEFAGEYWLEVFLLGGVTTVETQKKLLAHCIRLIGPDKVQVNTVSRPPAEDFAMAVPLERLKEVALQLSQEVEIVATNRRAYEQCDISARLEDVLALLRRSPCSVEDIMHGLGLHRNAVLKYIEQLCLERQARLEHTDQGRFYRALV